ncbi:unnamed protein product [Microthlaspi erraticum]|uniref:Uncharacterized protein n=1 Tax=Microthlaspi erraticum TaxID=1685480 RepID=A0A6D2HQG2_9BRAS|nr:unnamed protein product [Microthlaspi erraticum]
MEPEFACVLRFGKVVDLLRYKVVELEAPVSHLPVVISGCLLLVVCIRRRARSRSSSAWAKLCKSESSFSAGLRGINDRRRLATCSSAGASASQLCDKENGVSPDAVLGVVRCDQSTPSNSSAQAPW